MQVHYTWQNGRQLASYTDETNTINYKYDEEGIRTEKKINDKTYKYYHENSNIIFEERPEGTTYYNYDADGIIGFEYKDKQYYYEKNQQNDIIGILDSELNKIVTYTYDSWGKLINILDSNGKEIKDSSHIGNINPFRYRSYYYDTETQLYYLNSRYYNPDMGRFINADGIMGANEDNLSYNLYTYVSNNPINAKDKDGNFAQFVVGAIFAVAIGYDIYQAITNPSPENIAVAASNFVPSGKVASTGWKITSNVFKTTAKKTTAKTITKNIAQGSTCKPAFKVDIPKLTTPEITKIAGSLGYTKTNFYTPNGQAIYKKGKNYISYDWDSHNGGFWKMAESEKDFTKTRRLGTYNIDLKERIKN